MRDKDKISIIIPVYNIENYIVNAVDSALNQTYDNIEVIVVNDGSSDNTQNILDELVLKEERLKVIHKENEGVTKARLTGVSAATGEWIGFIDGDDIVDLDMYERLLNNAHKYTAKISHCGYQMVFPDRIDYYYNTGRVVCQDNTTGLRDLLKGTFIEPGLCNKLFHNTLFHSILHGNVMDLSIRNYEDLLMNYYLFKESDVSVYEDWCPYHYMLRKGSAATAKINQHKLEDPLKVLKIIREQLSDKELIDIIDSRILMNLVGMATMSCGRQDDFIKHYKLQARKELKELLKQVNRPNMNKKVLLQAQVASLWPDLYTLVHRVYSKARGTDKKYEIQ